METLGSSASPEPAKLSPRAQALFQNVFAPRVAAISREVAATPLVILLWGPGAGSLALYVKRVQIRDALRRLGHAAFFDEELEKEQPAPISGQVAQVVRAENADLAIVIAVSHSTVATASDFANDRVVEQKLVIFIPDDAADHAAYQAAVTRLKQHYDSVQTFRFPDDIASCRLKTMALEKVSRLQMVKWRMMNAASWGTGQNVVA